MFGEWPIFQQKALFDISCLHRNNCCNYIYLKRRLRLYNNVVFSKFLCCSLELFIVEIIWSHFDVNCLSLFFLLIILHNTSKLLSTKHEHCYLLYITSRTLLNCSWNQVILFTFIRSWRWNFYVSICRSFAVILLVVDM